MRYSYLTHLAVGAQGFLFRPPAIVENLVMGEGTFHKDVSSSNLRPSVGFHLMHCSLPEALFESSNASILLVSLVQILSSHPCVVFKFKVECLIC